MLPIEIKQLIIAKFPHAKVEVATDDNQHFSATIVDNQFTGVSLVNRQRQVYSAINDQIISGEIHAISFKALTEEEFNK